MTGPLDRERLGELFDELSDELKWTKTRAQIYIVGGAAMSLAFSRDRTTQDVDARIDAGHYRLTEAVRKLGRKHGLGDTWLNDQATTAIPRRKDTAARTVYQSPYLTVTGASAEHLLGMKLLAAREADEDDIRALVEHLKLTRAEEAIAVYEELFPDEPLKTRARQVLKGILPAPPRTGTPND